jgi:hypothetical protein
MLDVIDRDASTLDWKDLDPTMLVLLRPEH